MKQNVGILDTAIRSVIAVILLALAAEGIFTPLVNVALVVVGMLIWASCSFGVCMIYNLLGVDTYPDGGNGLTQH